MTVHDGGRGVVLSKNKKITQSSLEGKEEGKIKYRKYFLDTEVGGFL